jgi:lipopolysaccharide/colanic/teichoic acid biosynthesis glycosyltransferase
VGKRALDFVASIAGMILLSPLLMAVAVSIYLYDRHSPFYVAPRIGRGGRAFRMVKFRSMIIGADKTGVTSTSAIDRRVTPVGAFVRRYKLDEFVQLWNVLKGDMSFVGPRPNVEAGIRLYTSEERRLLTVRPGITDFASIVFSDEGEILRPYADADTAYDRLVRPWKSRLGLFYVDERSLLVDLILIWITAISVISRRQALRMVEMELRRLGAPEDLIQVAGRTGKLLPVDPPGF